MTRETSRPTLAEIDLGSLRFNFRSSRDFIGSGVKYMAVVKADAYGHGAVECSRALEAEGVDWLGVALVEEAVELRDAGCRLPVLCLGGAWEGQEETILKRSITPAIFTLSQAERLHAAAERRGESLAVHIKIDTGMGRVGVRHDRVPEFAERLVKLSRLTVEGLMTHFAAADDLAETDFTQMQTRRFWESVETFRKVGIEPEYLDLANSPAAVAHPATRSNMVRLGGILYGLGGDVLPGSAPRPKLRPVLSLKTRIAQIKSVPEGETLGYSRAFKTKRDSTIATIPIGYADGLCRGLSNVGEVIVRGRRAPIVGRISMDWTIVDVTDVGGAAEGDPVTIIGRDGGEEILAEDVARMTETISYEVTCSIGRRIPRNYKGGP
ncbi:MAG: alanine racemase [Pyrinomonadaceae bacterium]